MRGAPVTWWPIILQPARACVGGQRPRPGRSGSHRPIELLRYIAVLEDCLGRTAIKNLLPMQLGDVPDTYADVEALIEDVGYQPTTTVEDGIARFVAWYRRYYRV